MRNLSAIVAVLLANAKPDFTAFNTSILSDLRAGTPQTFHSLGFETLKAQVPSRPKFEAKQWVGRYIWHRHESGAVTVTNPRTLCRLTFKNMGHALRAAQAAKGKETHFVTVSEDGKETVTRYRNGEYLNG